MKREARNVKRVRKTMCRSVVADGGGEVCPRNSIIRPPAKVACPGDNRNPIFGEKARRATLAHDGLIEKNQSKSNLIKVNQSNFFLRMPLFGPKVQILHAQDRGVPLVAIGAAPSHLVVRSLTFEWVENRACNPFLHNGIQPNTT